MTTADPLGRLDPQLIPFIEEDRDRPRPGESPLETVRADRAGRRAARYAPLPGVTTTSRTVPGIGAEPDTTVLVTRRDDVRERGEAHPEPVLLWIHGGGYVMGSADQNQLWVDGIVADLGCTVVSVDYRLAPETAHPGPLEDCYAALVWIQEHAGELGIDTQRIVIGGESAGGGLAASLSILAKDRGRPPARLQLLIYPMLDDRTGAVPRGDGTPASRPFVWTVQENVLGWTSLLGHAPGRDTEDPYAAPARRDDLSGLPNAFIAVGDLDLFLEEDVDFALRLLRAGVHVELHVHPGAPHGYFGVDGADVSNRLRREAAEALQSAFTA